jgi:sulfiredoxin
MTRTSVEPVRGDRISRWRLSETYHDEARKSAIANIYVPIKRRATLKPETVQEIAQSILEVGQQAPILVRRDGDRFVLVHGLHRLEACKARTSLDVCW